MTPPDDAAWDSEVRRLAGPGRAATAGAFIDRLPAGYRAGNSPAEALGDLDQIDRLGPDRDDTDWQDTGREDTGREDTGREEPPVGAGAGEARPPESTGRLLPMGSAHRLVVRPSGDPSCTFRLRRFGRHGIELTTTLPLLESFGLVVVEAVPYRLRTGPTGEPELHIDDIGVRAEAPYGEEALRFVPTVHGDRLVEAIEASARGAADVDSLNRLVTGAGLDWRQVMVLRAYLRYWLQTGAAPPWEQMADPLSSYPDVARALVAYFQARFDPDGPPASERPAAVEAARSLVVAQLDLVTSLEQDRVLRAVLALIDATLRTTHYAAAGEAGRPLVLKLDSRAVPGLPRPVPLVEAFVHGPTVEGVHLRAGLVARGGLRWSERPSDFRTEVLDLAFAQVKKNAIIVPTGAKGGFVYRRPGRPSAEEIRAAYQLFVGGLLDVTDNLVDGQAVSPPGVVPADGPDPYLVVAADKGTATFSDLANDMSAARGFWLGDAFASGGSHGYDHKAMGITARGAWVAVRRHFRELGIDVSRHPITVAGVGDMSGDVFGNGMLRSRAIRLVAAFDHRHVFLDPDPDPEASFEERRRLAVLPRSTWADYDPAALSPGGGVWSRQDKTVPLSAPIRQILGVDEEQLRPPEVVAAILGAPVDLLWFGGIGTYIKAPGEADTDVGDSANDAVRVTSDRIRARVIAEGANLGVTQRARIRYSRRGGRINADFIDNAAGVATSDREVNLKILLALAAERGRLDGGDRDGYLADATEEVAAEVLRQVDHSVSALNRAATVSDRYLDAYEALIDDLERAGRFDREVEVLPSREEFALRRQAGAGLIRPELATVLTYAKTELVAAIEAADWVADEFLEGAVLPYFPGRMRADFADLVPEHRLYRSLVATDVAGELVDRMGVVWAHDLADELGRPLADVAAAFWAAREVTAAGKLWAELEGLAADEKVTAAAEAALHDAVADAVTTLARRYLAGPGPLSPGEVAGRDSSRLEAAGGDTEDPPVPVPPGWSELEIDPARAARFLGPYRRVGRLEAASVAIEAGRGPEAAAQAAAVLAGVHREAGLDRLMAAVDEVLRASPPPGRLRTWLARGALDDIVVWRRRAAVAVLRRGGGEAPPSVAAWRSEREQDLAAAAVVAAQAAGTDSLAPVLLALRRLERVLA